LLFHQYKKLEQIIATTSKGIKDSEALTLFYDAFLFVGNPRTRPKTAPYIELLTGELVIEHPLLQPIK